MEKIEFEKIEFQEGCMWEGDPWEIRFDYWCRKTGGGKPCKHCRSEGIIVHERYGHERKEHMWKCPRVVVAWNEGGCNNTGMCLDCILEAASTLKDS